jgi:hypothetical protein
MNELREHNFAQSYSIRFDHNSGLENGIAFQPVWLQFTSRTHPAGVSHGGSLFAESDLALTFLGRLGIPNNLDVIFLKWALGAASVCDELLE